MALCQQNRAPISLGAPQLVAKKVQSVFWSDDGKSLIYLQEMKQGLGVGVYDLDSEDGRVVSTLPEGTVIDQVQWLSVGKRAISVTRTAKETLTLSVLAIDAHALTSAQIWTRTFAPETDASIQISVSPSRPHALLTVYKDKDKEPWVLLQNGTSLVFSRDIVSAQKDGMDFAGWSKDGTALFGPNTAPSFTFEVDPKTTAVKDPEGQPTENGNQVNFSISTLEIRLDRFKFIGRVQPNYPQGSAVQECMPTNGALRQIRFDGYYNFESDSGNAASTREVPQLLVLGKAKEGTKALWLVPLSPPAKAQSPEVAVLEKAEGEPEWAVLVSAQADEVWAAPGMKSVAFTWNGALFVRPVKLVKTL